MGWVVGLDVHKDTIAAAVLRPTGDLAAEATFDNTSLGHVELHTWITSKATDSRCGLEPSGGVGHAAAAHLQRKGVDVVLVPSRLSAREAARNRRRGKTDPGDAVAIARVVQREDRLPVFRHGDQHEDLKLLVDYRDQLHHERTRVCNRLHADLAIAYPGYQRGIGKALTSRRSLNKVDELLAADHSVRADLDRQRLARLREIDAELKQVVIQLEVLIEASGSALVDIVASVPWSLRVCSARSATLGGSRLLRRLPPATAPHRSTRRRAATNATASTAAATGGSIGRSTRSLSPRHATNLEPPTTSPANALPATPVEEPYAASSAASPTSSTEPCSKTPPDLTHRS